MKRECDFGVRAVLSGCLNRSICQAEVDENGHLILGMTDGSRLDAGLVRLDSDSGQAAALTELRAELEQAKAKLAEVNTLAQGALPTQGGAMTGNLRMAPSSMIHWGRGMAGIYSDDGEHIVLQSAEGEVYIDLGHSSVFNERVIALGGAWHIDVRDAQICNVAAPERDSDAATKGYVDAHKGGLTPEQEQKLNNAATTSYVDTVVSNAISGLHELADEILEGM